MGRRELLGSYRASGGAQLNHQGTTYGPKLGRIGVPIIAWAKPNVEFGALLRSFIKLPNELIFQFCFLTEVGRPPCSIEKSMQSFLALLRRSFTPSRCLV